MKFKDLVDDIVVCQVPCPTCGAAAGRHCGSDWPGLSRIHAARKRARRALGKAE
jgi:hypothetical protein